VIKVFIECTHILRVLSYSDWKSVSQVKMVRVLIRAHRSSLLDTLGMLGIFLDWEVR